MSAASSLSTAFQHTKRVLFQPFEPRRYLVIAFSMWLYQLGELGGAAGGRGVPSQRAGDLSISDLDGTWFAVVGTAAFVALIVGVAVGAVVLWLRSAGAFLALANLTGEAGISAPWRHHRSEAGSLFRFRLGLHLLGLLGFLAVTGASLAAAWGTWTGGRIEPATMLSLGGGFLGASLVASVVVLADAAATELVAPVMFVRHASFGDALHDVAGYVRRDVGGFLSFVALRLGITIAGGVVAVVVTVATCGLAALPFLGTLLLLPVLVYLRVYSMHWVAGLSDDLRALILPPAPIQVRFPEPPVLGERS